MKRNDLIKALLDESNDIQVPDVIKEVRETPITIIPIEIRPAKPKNRLYAPLLRMFVIFALSIGIFYSVITKAETKVTIDINPSIEFTINRFDKVIAVKAYNESGEEFLSGLNVNYCTTEEAISRIISHAEQKGYLSENTTNALLYSVSSIADCTYKYESKLKNAFLSAFSKIGAKGIFHSVEPSAQDEQEASKLGISPAKLAFIRELYAKRTNKDCSPSEVPKEYLDDTVTEIVTRLSA